MRTDSSFISLWRPTRLGRQQAGGDSRPAPSVAQGQGGAAGRARRGPGSRPSQVRELAGQVSRAPPDARGPAYSHFGLYFLFAQAV